MTLTRTAARLLAVLLPALPAAGQPAPAASPAPPAPLPPAWTVTTNEALRSVRIAATAKTGAVQFVATCKAGEDGIAGTFSGYKGTGLRTDGQVEALSLFAQGAEWQDAFSIRVRYDSASRTWVLANPLSPIFLNSFSRGATLVVTTNRNQELFSFDLTGSTAATRAMRTTCALP